MTLHRILHIAVAAVAATAGITLQAQQYQWSNFVGTPGGVGNADGPAAMARFDQPRGIAEDGTGNLFVADAYNHTIRKITPTGVVSTFAGKTGTVGTANGTGGTARFNQPEQLAFGPGGVLYVADRANNCIRKISTTGVVSTLAGAAGLSGTANGTGVAARFSGPGGLAVDASGNVYVADTSNHTIRKITTGGVVATLAGSPGVDGNADGTAGAALFSRPERLTLAGGALFVTDHGNDTIRKVTLAGVVTTFAGEAGTEGSADGPGIDARFSGPMAITSDSTGNLFVGDERNRTLRKITPAGAVTTLAGNPGVYGHADGSGVAATFSTLYGLSISATGVMHAADSENHVIRRVTQAGVVTTIAGSPDSSGNADGTGTLAAFNNPTGMAVSATGELWVADTANDTIRKVTPAGEVTTYAGSTNGSTDGPRASATFSGPGGLSLDSNGNLWVADSANGTVRMITAAGTVSTLAGTAGQFNIIDDTGPAAAFNSPQGLVVDGAGNGYVTEGSASIIRKVTPGGIVSTVAGNEETGWVNGTGTAARFSGPRSIGADLAGNLYTADSFSHIIRKISPTYEVTTLAGTGDSSGSADGTSAAARFNYPSGVAVSGDGTVFVADTNNHVIRRISSTGVVTTIGGTAGIASAQDGLSGAAKFSYPQRIAIGPDGTLYVTDKNNRIVKGAALPEISVEQPVSIALIDGVGSTHFGKVAIGQTAVRSFTIRNESEGGLSLSGLALSVTGAHAADFTTANLGATSLAPGASTTFEVTFHANTDGNRHAIVHLASNDADESSFDIAVNGITDGGPIPTQIPVPQVGYVGGSATFTSTSTHPNLPVTKQWMKNGIAIPGATANDLTLSNLALTDATTYSVVLTAGGKSVTHSATLSVIKAVPPQTVAAKFGTKATFTVTNTAGVGSFRWRKHSALIPNSNSKTLTLSGLTAGADSAPYFCFLVRQDGVEFLVARFDLHVFDTTPFIAPMQHMPDGAVGSPYAHQIVVGNNANIAPLSYAASGLPPGVTLNTRTGLISGMPTVSKVYTIVVSAINSLGKVSSTDTVHIAPLPAGVVGKFMGAVRPQTPAGTLNGRIDFTVSTAGVITGSTVIGAVKYPFVTKINTTGAQPTATVTILRPNTTPLTTSLVFNPSVNATVPTSSMTSGPHSSSISAWRQVWRTTGALPLNPATAVAKRYNLALDPAVGAGLPEGGGFGTFTLVPTGVLTVVGKTPEGDSFTTAGFAGPWGQVLVCQSLYSHKGMLIGLLDIDPTNVGVPTDELNGALAWTRPADITSRNSPSGFTNLTLTAFGGLYSPPVAPSLVLGMTLGDKATLDFSGGGLSTASINPNVATFDIIGANVAVLPTALSSGNPGSVKLTKINAATGQFNGSYTLSDNELRTGALFAGKKYIRVVPFSGVLTDDISGPVGVGNFLLPELPSDTTPPTKTLIKSGYVQFEKQP
jgi:sugar lactone lactonase YvrE